MAQVAKALGDPVRCSLRTCCDGTPARPASQELVPLFGISRPAVSHHLKVLREAGIVGSERRGLWAYCFVIPDAPAELSAWLS